MSSPHPLTPNSITQKSVTNATHQTDLAILYADAEAMGRIGAWSYVVATKQFCCSQGLSDLTGLPQPSSSPPIENIWPLYSARIHADDVAPVSKMLRDVFNDGGQQNYVYRYQHPTQGWRWFNGSCAILLDAQGEKVGTRGIIADVTEQHLAAEQLRYASLHDELTGLPNRKHLEIVLAQILSHTTAHHSAPDSVSATADNPQASGIFVLYIDLDRYKIINDTLGHEAGDTALCEVVKRLKSTLSAEDVLARVGGDEFIAVLQRRPYVEEAVATSQHMLKALKPPVQVLDHHFSISASIGVAVNSSYINDALSLMRMADKAMYAVKASGKNAVQVYSDAMDAHRRTQLEIESELSKAIRNNELSMHFQPIQHAQSGRWDCCEALVRWQHPTLGHVSAQYFVEMAERGVLIHHLGRWVASYATQALSQLHSIGYKNLTTSINVSVQQCLDARFIDRLRKALDVAQLPPSALKIEITESAVMARFDEALPKLEELRRLGMGLVIDDFGVGQSSLARLRDLPATEVKIDRSFVAELGRNDRNDAIVTAAIDLAHRLGMLVTCEGVERNDQLSMVYGLGTDFIQGNLISAPMSQAQLIERLAANKAA